MAREVISLTQDISVADGSHILYFYDSPADYIDNVVSFILAGLHLGQHIVLIDSTARFALVEQRLKETLTAEEISQIHYINNQEFYGSYGDFHFERVLERFSDAVQPFVDNRVAVRLWGHVEWREQQEVIAKLNSYEHNADISVSELGYLTVCAYNGHEVPAVFQTEMLKHHEFQMTDHELVRSNLYRSATIKPTVFPSLSASTRMKSEMDLYKQKLEFVHVVSHEVRNPLTIIKAYSSLLQNDEPDESRRRKLQDIYDYAVVIDNEISHIISTEQMLSTESFWSKKMVLPVPLLQEVLDIMSIKARTQNIRLQATIRLIGTETIRCNAMGFKLIISNILSNAIKYSHENGTVHFQCDLDHRSLILEVRDEGVGMTEDQLSRLFQKYEKMNDDKSGQGIGLYMVKQLLNHFDGEITVESRPEQGSTFQIKLPLFSAKKA